MPQTDTRQHAHNLIDRMAPSQTSNAVTMLERMLAPYAHVPYEDEPISEEETRDAAAAKAAFARGEFISNEEVLAEFGLTQEDFERMGRTSIRS